LKSIENIDLSVIVCSYNRCKTLAKTLESLAVSTVPSSVTWEIVVVDNNSTDQTRQVIEEFCHRYPTRFRYLFVSAQGKSFALNAGIQASRGKVLAFTDDDVIVEPTWLYALTQSMTEGPWVGVGGRTLPETTFSMPTWLRLDVPHALGPLAVFDLGNEACELTESPYGNNMAFRREVFYRIGVFKTELGPCPGSEIRGEDTDFGTRLLATGDRLRYEPGAVVYHAVPPQRVQKSYFLAWWFAKARADIRQMGLPTDAGRPVLGVPIYLFRRLLVWSVLWLSSVSPSWRFFRKRQVWSIAGTIKECYTRSRTYGR